jgi:putative CocE/NonD family hydrolase
MGKVIITTLVVLLSIIAAVYFAPLPLSSYVFAVYVGLPLPKLSVDYVTHYVEVAPGITLRTDHYYPSSVDLKETNTEFPTTLIRSPYGLAPGQTLFGFINTMECYYLASQGYHALSQSVRGWQRYGSGGVWKPFYHERQDGRATLKWISSQPWFNGNLGTLGESYLGYTQLALIGEDAAIQPKAHIPVITSANFYDAIHHRENGAVDTSLLIGWIFERYEEGRLSKDAGAYAVMQQGNRWSNDPSLIWNASMVVPLLNSDEVTMGNVVPEFRAILKAYNATDEYWGTSSAHADVIASDGDAFHFISGWADVFINDTFGHYEQKQSEGKNAYLTVYNGDHYSFFPFETFKEVNSWLQYRLKGDQSLLRQKRVALQLNPTTNWLYFDAWPPASSLKTIYLSKAVEGDFRGVLTEDKTKVAEDGTLSYVYDPEKPTPQFAGTSLFFGGNTNNLQLLLKQQNVEKDVLIFTSSALPNDVIISGRPEFHLVVSSSLGYTDFYVSLYDYDAKKNTSFNVCEGFVRTTPSTQVKNEDDSFSVQIKCTPITHLFSASHQIMLQVASGAHPHWSRNPGTGEHISTATTFLKAEQKIYPHLSSFILPILKS